MKIYVNEGYYKNAKHKRVQMNLDKNYNAMNIEYVNTDMIQDNDGMNYVQSTHICPIYNINRGFQKMVPYIGK